MIKDKLKNAKNYYGISENLKNGFEWLKKQDLESIKPDKYYINDENIYANVQEYQTKETALYEAHRKYIDIQYMIRGNEVVGVCDKEYCKTNIKYDPEADIEFMDCCIEDPWQTLNEGEFIVLFPNDAHKPSITPDKTSSPNIVKKVVVKVAIG